MWREEHSLRRASHNLCSFSHRTRYRAGDGRGQSSQNVGEIKGVPKVKLYFTHCVFIDIESTPFNYGLIPLLPHVPVLVGVC